MPSSPAREYEMEWKKIVSPLSHVIGCDSTLGITSEAMYVSGRLVEEVSG